MPYICVLGAYGEHGGTCMVKECLSRAAAGVVATFLVRPGYEAHPEKKERVDELISLGAVPVSGDASDLPSLVKAFAGVDIVISCLGGWGDLLLAHRNVYEACRANGVGRVVPAQFGFDVLSFQEESMDACVRSRAQCLVVMLVIVYPLGTSSSRMRGTLRALKAVFRTQSCRRAPFPSGLSIPKTTFSSITPAAACCTWAVQRPRAGSRPLSKTLPALLLIVCSILQWPTPASPLQEPPCWLLILLRC